MCAPPLLGQAILESETSVAKPRRGKAARKPVPASVEPDLEAEGDAARDDRQFVTALARGLDILAAFRPGESSLGNQELAQRTGLPKPTVSRITFTLTRMGYLFHNQRLGTYELGSAVLSLGYVALANRDIRRIAKPLMQELADASGYNVALGVRDRLSMLEVEACEGPSLVGLRLSAGSRIPLANTAQGRAYLAALTEAEREPLLELIRHRVGAEWPRVEAGIARAIAEIGEKGFCISIGEWQSDIHGVGVPLRLPDGRDPYALVMGGPAYLMPAKRLIRDFAPRLAQVAAQLIQGGTAR